MRQIINLNGCWAFIPDFDSEFRGVGYYSHPDVDKSNWEQVLVPACWNKYGEKYSIFEGVAWYSKEFHLKKTDNKQISFLRFGAVNYYAHIFLNGVLIGNHEGGYTEFLIDATNHIKKGRNVLVVRVDNRNNLIKFPAQMGWFNYGGIHRGVQLELSQEVRIENLLVSAFPEKNRGIGQIRLNLNSKDNLFSLKIQIKIFNPAGKIIWENKELISGNEKILQVRYKFQIKNPLLWNPELPNLYKCRVSIKGPDESELDYLEITFGVRKLTANGRVLLLNEKKIWIKGISYLYDHPSTGITFEKKVIKDDLASLRKLGVNTLRSHFPVPEIMLDECDKQGIMLWIEVPVYCLAPKNDKISSKFTQPEYISLARQMVKEMILQAYNHPSVVFWSIGNECNTEHPEAKDFFKALVSQVREIDTHRLISYASLYTEAGCAGELVDVIGINEYWGWYDRCYKESKGAPNLDKLEKELSKFIKKTPKPILLTEFGADAVPDYRSKDLELWSEDYQAFFLESTFKVIKKFPEICGAFPFLYNDYPDPSKPVNKYWKGLNLKGIVSYNRTKKVAFDVMKKIYVEGK